MALWQWWRGRRMDPPHIPINLADWGRMAEMVNAYAEVLDALQYGYAYVDDAGAFLHLRNPEDTGDVLRVSLRAPPWRAPQPMEKKHAEALRRAIGLRGVTPR